MSCICNHSSPTFLMSFLLTYLHFYTKLILNCCSQRRYLFIVSSVKSIIVSAAIQCRCFILSFPRSSQEQVKLYCSIFHLNNGYKVGFSESKYSLMAYLFYLPKTIQFSYRLYKMIISKLNSILLDILRLGAIKR